MFLAYVDDSGDRGAAGSRTYVLACVLVHADDWPRVFDELIAYRRFLRQNFNIPMRGELKANHFVRNAGVFRGLGLDDTKRARVFRLTMRIEPKLGLQTFAVVIDKVALEAARPGVDPRLLAWEYMLQRLERFTTTGNTTAMLFHDEGEADLIRGLVRKARRAGSAGSAFGTGSLRRPARLLIEDPVSRDSEQSYFIQLADLNAYAAYRRYFPSAHPSPVVPTTSWDELGGARYAKANYLAGGPPGIVKYP